MPTCIDIGRSAWSMGYLNCTTRQLQVVGIYVKFTIVSSRPSFRSTENYSDLFVAVHHLTLEVSTGVLIHSSFWEGLKAVP